MLLKGKDALNFIRQTKKPIIKKNPEAKHFLSECINIITKKKKNKSSNKDLS